MFHTVCAATPMKAATDNQGLYAVVQNRAGKSHCIGAGWQLRSKAPSSSREDRGCAACNFQARSHHSHLWAVWKYPIAENIRLRELPPTTAVDSPADRFESALPQ